VLNVTLGSSNTTVLGKLVSRDDANAISAAVGSEPGTVVWPRSCLHIRFRLQRLYRRCDHDDNITHSKKNCRRL